MVFTSNFSMRLHGGMFCSEITFIFIGDHQPSFKVFLFHKTIKLQMSISNVEWNWLTSLNTQQSKYISICLYLPEVQKWRISTWLTKPVTLWRVEDRGLTTGRKVCFPIRHHIQNASGAETLQFIEYCGNFPRGIVFGAWSRSLISN
jgi:hypothetical protein